MVPVPGVRLVGRAIFRNRRSLIARVRLRSFDDRPRHDGISHYPGARHLLLSRTFANDMVASVDFGSLTSARRISVASFCFPSPRSTSALLSFNAKRFGSGSGASPSSILSRRSLGVAAKLENFCQPGAKRGTFSTICCRTAAAPDPAPQKAV